LAFLTVGGSTFGESSAWAQSADYAEGRASAVRGFKAYKLTDYGTALAAFEEARKLYPAGQVLRLWGYTLLALERWGEAHSALEQALKAELKPLPDSVRPEVRENIDKARSHLALVTIRSRSSGASVAIDGGPEEALPIEGRLLAEGAHQLRATAPDHDDTERSVDLRGGSSPTIDIDLEAKKSNVVEKTESAEPPSGVPAWVRPAALGGAAVGLTAVGAGLATLLSGRSLTAQVNDRNAQLAHQWPTTCMSSALAGCYQAAEANHRDAQRAYQLEAAGLSLMISGAALAAAGTTTLILFTPTAAEPSKSSLQCSPAVLGARCSLTF
jgi:tetratricopeptide (TPR) repeat protein